MKSAKRIYEISATESKNLQLEIARILHNLLMLYNLTHITQLTGCCREMYQPKLYAENGLHARRDTVEVLNKHINKLNLKQNANVMDVGSGPGNVTHDILLPMLPKTLENLVGIDVSPEMVNYAKMQYESKSKIVFHNMDILSEFVPEQFQNTFHHIFSFYCLHMVDDHRKALQNMHDMLKPGGSILLTFMGKCFLYNIYESMCKNPEWKKYMCNYQKLIPVTQFHEQALDYYHSLLKEIGFESLECSAEKKVYEYPEQLFKNTLLAVNVFNIPTDKEEEFVLDHLKVLKDHGLTESNADNEIIYLLPYTLFVINAIKHF